MNTIKRKILIVDDDIHLLHTTKELLEIEGYEVTIQGNSLGTIKNIIKSRPDLVLLDINMPVLSGEKIAEILTNEFWNRTTKILFHSSNDEDTLRKAVKTYGVNGYICKGNLSELRRKVELQLN